ncbi:MAG: acetate/propionate family kinase [Bacillus sp. (in: firmicutes)]
MHKIMAINAGSSSLKFQIFEMPDEEVIVKGIFERIGLEHSIFSMIYKGKKMVENVSISTHEDAVSFLLEQLKVHQIVCDLKEIMGVGHRVAHGGERFVCSCIVDDEALKEIEEISHLAPLHNPANVMGIKAFKTLLPHAASVAVFDTAFHQTMPKENYIYPIPYHFYEKNHIRKYGFHGTSHKYVAEKAAELVGAPIEKLKIVSCHLGNGASICAIDGGKSVNTSMGFTPISGLPMGTRCGSLDPSIIPQMMKSMNASADEIMALLNKESGLLGVSEFSSDIRDLEKAIDQGDKQARLAVNMFVARIQEYIGSYAATMNGCDVLIFTAGIGENSQAIRNLVTSKLSYLGVTCDEVKNIQNECIISEDDAKVKVCVIPTNEELMIARDVEQLVLLQKV